MQDGPGNAHSLAEDALKKQSLILAQRQRQLICLYGLSRLTEIKDIALPDVFRGLIGLLPGAWQYPEIAVARLIYEGDEYISQNWKETPWKQSCDIKMRGEKAGTLEICYLTEKPECYNGPFLKEEEELLNSVAEGLGRVSDRIEAGLELEEKEKRFETIINSIQTAIIIIDPATHMVEYVNVLAARLIGLPKGSIVGNVCFKFICASEEGQCPITDLGKIVDKRETSLHTTSGGTVPVIKTVTNINVNGKDLLLESFMDISDVKRLEEQLKQSEKRYRTIIEEMSDSYYEVDLAGNFTFVNSRVLNDLGYSRHEFIGINYRIVTAEEDIEVLRTAYNHVYRTGEPNRGIASKMVRKDGSNAYIETAISLIKDEAGNKIGFRSVSRDVTERVQLQKKLAEMATHDVLTGLPNRVLLKDRFFVGFAQAQRKNAKLAIIALDLDRFKTVNDTFGHNIGDKLLQEVAVRLSNAVRRSDTVARVGGDEFIIVMPEITQDKEATMVAQRVLDAFREPYMLAGRELLITTSLGIALCPDAGDNLETLLKNADAAMYCAKEQGRNCYRLFSVEKGENIKQPDAKNLLN
jgi:diguanylate cyclase (GGDEF)-like protein/PAS domain S-box-containing protein